MEIKQVKFWDKEVDDLKGGIRLDDGRLICGCCGEIMGEDDYVILKEYDDWVDCSEEIMDF